MSTDLINWKDISEKVTFPEGARHGTMFQADSKILEKLLKTGK